MGVSGGRTGCQNKRACESAFASADASDSPTRKASCVAVILRLWLLRARAVPAPRDGGNALTPVYNLLPPPRERQHPMEAACCTALTFLTVSIMSFMVGGHECCLAETWLMPAA